MTLLRMNDLNYLNDSTEILTHWSIMGHGVHAEGQFLFWVLVKLLPQCKCLSNHLALLDPLGFIVAAANNPDTGA